MVGLTNYHAILFFDKSVDWLLIQSSWGKGIVDIRPFNSNRAGYVAKYSVKQMEFDYCGRTPPFHLQSKGLGECFLNGKSFQSLNYSRYWKNLSGHSVKLPRYYLDKLGTTRKTFVLNYSFGSFKRSYSVHSSGYRYSNELAYVNFVRHDKLAFLSSGVTPSLFEQNRIKRQQMLEHNLISLNLKSYYYEQSSYESRTFNFLHEGEVQRKS